MTNSTAASVALKMDEALFRERHGDLDLASIPDEELLLRLYVAAREEGIFDERKTTAELALTVVGGVSWVPVSVNVLLPKPPRDLPPDTQLSVCVLRERQPAFSTCWGTPEEAARHSETAAAEARIYLGELRRRAAIRNDPALAEATH